MGKIDSLNVCGKCGAHCCTYGGTIATKEEVDKISKAGYKNSFVKLSKNVFITKWGKEGICPYLKNKECSIYSVRPTLCQIYPILMLNENDFYLQHCPLLSYLSVNEVKKAKKIIRSLPSEMILCANKYLKPYEKILSKRINKYILEKIK